MELHTIDPHVTAFIRPEDGANVGLVRTPDGLVVIDTTSFPEDMRALLSAAGVEAGQARWVINTHFHGDHISGNQLFGCPILAHSLCRQRLAVDAGEDYGLSRIAAQIAEVAKTDPSRAQVLREKSAGMKLTLPTETFDQQRKLEIGGVQLEVIHLGGHTPDLSIIWLPDQGVLFASDLIFQGRYPYIFDSDVPVWIEALGKLLEFKARAVVPGHGVLCGEAEIKALASYFKATWRLTAEHLRQGHSLGETLADASYPRYAEKQAERLHTANIQHMYQQLQQKSS